MNRKPRGFTLLEVMVALAIIAIALSVMIAAAGHNASNIGYLRDKTFAHWVAMNRIAEMRAMRQFPRVGRHDGSEILGGHEWFYVMNVELTQVKKVKRVDVTVRADERNDSPTLETLSTFYAEEDKDRDKLGQDTGEEGEQNSPPSDEQDQGQGEGQDPRGQPSADEGAP